MPEMRARLPIMINILSGFVGGALAAFFMLGSSVVAQPTPVVDPLATNPENSQQTISAREFRLIDDSGRIRGLLAFTRDGQPFFQLRDEFDTYRVWMGISSDTGVAVRDVDGKTRLLLGVDEEGDPSLVLRDRKHQTKSFHP